MEIHEAGTQVLENKGFLCVFLLQETVRLSDRQSVDNPRQEMTRARGNVIHKQGPNLTK